MARARRAAKNKKSHVMILSILFLLRIHVAVGQDYWVNSSDYLYSDVAPANESYAERLWPPIANGRIGFVPHAGRMYVRGVWNGILWDASMTKFDNLSHNAALPNLHDVDAPNLVPTAWIFDLNDASYVMRYTVGNATVNSTLESRTFAHRYLSTVFVTTLSLVAGPAIAMPDLQFTFRNLTAAAMTNYTDFKFTDVDSECILGSTVMSETATTNASGEEYFASVCVLCSHSTVHSVAVCRQMILPSQLTDTTPALIMTSIASSTWNFTINNNDVPTDLVGSAKYFLNVTAQHSVDRLVHYQRIAWQQLRDDISIELEGNL
jgi:hypothetical protein